MSGRTADVVVIGAGVTGASLAFQLARRRAGRILVLEQSEVASGGSGRSSALVRMHYSFPAEVQLAVMSLELFRSWPDLVGRPSVFRQTGFLRIVPEAELERLERNVAMQRALGVNTSVVTRAELKEIEPGWNFDDVEEAAYEPDSGYGDGAVVAGDFLAAAKERGAGYASGTRVTGFEVRGGQIRGVHTSDGLIEAPTVVAATGPWSRPLFQAVGFDPPIETEYHQVAILKNPPGGFAGRSACIDSITKVYHRSETGGATLVGDFYGRRGVDPDAFPQAASAEALAKTVEAASRRIPCLADAGIARGVTGVYDMTPDARPLMGEVPGVAGLHLVAGFCGMGFKISPAVGLVMAERIAEGRATSVDITPFRPGRFLEGQPIRAEWEYVDD